MKILLSVFLLIISLIGFQCQSLESIPAGSAVKKPGETLSLSCKGSGFNFGSYGMHWIRQEAGKALEWIGVIWNDASKTVYAKHIEGHLEITRDNSKNMLYMKLTGLSAQDSAVYYCARNHSGTNMLPSCTKSSHRCQECIFTRPAGGATA
ncbi:hypothetical protein HF521_004884 [Silurus meridionalis]|uniref:Ig-like domain-containing protein n=1 Tax=Silurus meridionalis TaxID=175797 RepID=A0A8T0B0L3_SILME|nr:hypothetical protein HF521_004884 [Silurus meridionalis]